MSGTNVKPEEPEPDVQPEGRSTMPIGKDVSAPATGKCPTCADRIENGRIVTYCGDPAHVVARGTEPDPAPIDWETCSRGSDGCRIQGRHDLCGYIEPEADGIARNEAPAPDHHTVKPTQGCCTLLFDHLPEQCLTEDDIIQPGHTVKILLVEGQEPKLETVEDWKAAAEYMKAEALKWAGQLSVARKALRESLPYLELAVRTAQDFEVRERLADVRNQVRAALAEPQEQWRVTMSADDSAAGKLAREIEQEMDRIGWIGPDPHGQQVRAAIQPILARFIEERDQWRDEEVKRLLRAFDTHEKVEAEAATLRDECAKDNQFATCTRCGKPASDPVHEPAAEPEQGERIWDAMGRIIKVGEAIARKQHAEPPAPVAEPKCVLCEDGWPVQTDKNGGKFHIDFCGNFSDVVPEAGSIAPCPTPAPAAPDPVKPKRQEGE